MCVRYQNPIHLLFSFSLRLFVLLLKLFAPVSLSPCILEFSWGMLFLWDSRISSEIVLQTSLSVFTLYFKAADWVCGSFQVAPAVSLEYRPSALPLRLELSVMHDTPNLGLRFWSANTGTALMWWHRVVSPQSGSLLF